MSQDYVGSELDWTVKTLIALVCPEKQHGDWSEELIDGESKAEDLESSPQ
jgi:hypothetical protein